MSILKIVGRSNGEEQLVIYGPIGDNHNQLSTSAADVVARLSNMQASRLVVRINSDGGSVADGLAIYNALKRHSAKIEVHVDALAASVASLIAMAGDTVIMARNALLMIHAPWTLALGNSSELRTTADVLDTYGRAMATSYSAKSGKSEYAMLALLTDGVDHWYGASEAVAEGFADRVEVFTESSDAEMARAAAMSWRRFNAFSHPDWVRAVASRQIGSLNHLARYWRPHSNFIR